MAAEKVDVYQVITDRVIEMLEDGVAPWRKPWVADVDGPRNIEGRYYRGVNVFLLLFESMAHGYESPFWLTYNQAKQRGGSVKKGEKSTLVVFWKRLMITEKDETGKQVKKMIPMLRYFRVFNLEQTEGVKLPKKVAEFDAAKAREEAAGRVEADAVLAGYPQPPKVRDNGSAAFYVPASDTVTVPGRKSYPVADEYYSTLFHELGHSTGHKDRLNRKGITASDGFGGHEYGREELIAEMTAAFLCAETGITVTLANSASYLQSWVSTLREDTKAVVIAAGAAQRAADHILDRKFEQDTNGAAQQASPAA